MNSPRRYFVVSGYDNIINTDEITKIANGDSVLIVPMDIDGYGNIKTSLPASILNEQRAIKIIINETAHNIYVSKDGIFGTEDGNMVVAKGSSGWVSVENTNFLEISLRGGNACEAFTV